MNLFEQMNLWNLSIMNFNWRKWFEYWVNGYKCRIIIRRPTSVKERFFFGTLELGRLQITKLFSRSIVGRHVARLCLLHCVVCIFTDLVIFTRVLNALEKNAYLLNTLNLIKNIKFLVILSWTVESFPLVFVTLSRIREKCRCNFNF